MGDAASAAKRSERDSGTPAAGPFSDSLASSLAVSSDDATVSASARPA
jgi:hypothetical protein